MGGLHKPGAGGREFLARFGDQLSAWVSETSFGWGEWRESALPDVVARPPVIEVDPDS
jgi:hypothetical protein